MNSKWNFRLLVHNLLHPLAGIAWYLGFENIGDYLHSLPRDLDLDT